VGKKSFLHVFSKKEEEPGKKNLVEVEGLTAPLQGQKGGRFFVGKKNFGTALLVTWNCGKIREVVRTIIRKTQRTDGLGFNWKYSREKRFFFESGKSLKKRSAGWPSRKTEPSEDKARSE